MQRDDHHMVVALRAGDIIEHRREILFVRHRHDLGRNAGLAFLRSIISVNTQRRDTRTLRGCGIAFI